MAQQLCNVKLVPLDMIQVAHAVLYSRMLEEEEEALKAILRHVT